MIQAICWMLIHSLWQGLLLTILTGIVLVYTRRAAAALRYNLLSGLYFLFLTGCALTLVLEWNSSGNGEVGEQYAAVISASRLSSFITNLNDYLSDHASLIVMGWCFIFLFKCVRITAAVVYTQRIRNYGISQPPLYWTDKVRAFGAALHIKRIVLLLESRLVKMPLVTGHWKPVILIPLGLLTKLPEGEIEAVLLHELAHIRRNDYFMNFAQHIGESIFFFNPGLLWISALLREERENCCDDMAIDRTRNKQEFVRALIHFREHNLRLAGVTLAFPAGKNQLLHRVMRIAGNKNKSLNRAEKIFFIVSSFITSLLLVAATHQALRPADTPYKIVSDETNRIDPSSLIRALPQTGNTIGPYEPIPPGGLAFDDAIAYGSLATLAGQNMPVFRVKIQEDQAPTEGSSEEEQNAAEAARQALEEEKQDKAQREQQQAEDQRAERQRDQQQAIKDHQQTLQDQQQAIQDRRQADWDRAQADRDRRQAKLDREQLVQDRQLAVEGREQARLDKLQAEKAQADKLLAEKVQADKLQAEKMLKLDRLEKVETQRGDLLKKAAQSQEAKAAAVQAVLLRKQAERDKAQAEKDRITVAAVITSRTTAIRSTEVRTAKEPKH